MDSRRMKGKNTKAIVVGKCLYNVANWKVKAVERSKSYKIICI